MKFKQNILSIIVYYLLVPVWHVSKPMLRILVNLKIVSSPVLVDKYLYNFFRIFAYHGLMIVDIERYMDVGHYRAELMKKLDHWVEQRTIEKKDRYKIGFIGKLGNESVFSKDFYLKSPPNTEVYLYDMDSRSKAFDNIERINYVRLPELTHYQVSRRNYDQLLEIIESDCLDVLVIIANTFFLSVLDFLTVPSLIAFNTTSTLMPHPKCRNQIYIQPPWPWAFDGIRLKNIKSGKHLCFPAVHASYFYNARGAKFFNVRPLEKRKKQIFFNCGMEKILSNSFLETLIKVLKKDTDLIFLYYGGYSGNTLDRIQAKFKKSGVKPQTFYKDKYISYIDQNDQLIDDGYVYQAYQELFESCLFMNSFPISAARSCIEAFIAEVPVIQMDLDDSIWPDNQKRQPFKLTAILTETGTAGSVEEYLEKCIKVLNDEQFAMKIIKEQYELLSELTDSDIYWQKLLKIIETDIENTDINNLRFVEPKNSEWNEF